MPYGLILPPDVQTEIREYLASRFSTDEERLEAWQQIEAELFKLQSNPALGSAQWGGPFESRPVFRFSIRVSEVTRHIQVVYKVHRKDALVVISGFAPLSL